MEYKSWGEVPAHLKSKTYCNQNRLIIKNIEPVGKVYQRVSRAWIDLYDITKLEHKVALTEKEISAKEKAQATKRERYTCKSCNLYSVKDVDKETHLCTRCSRLLYSELYECEQSIQSLHERLLWSEDKERYVILDTETTGLYLEDEIVEIAIIELNGNTLYNSLIKPTKSISSEATRIHHITDKDVEDAPTMYDAYPEIDKILTNKIILAYNAAFDSDMLIQSCKKHGICIDGKYTYNCVMKNEMQIQKSERFISLANACSMEKCQQSHRALGDCILVQQLITDTKWIYEEIECNKIRIKEIEDRLNYKRDQDN